jgi:hypothetical protein
MACIAPILKLCGVDYSYYCDEIRLENCFPLDSELLSWRVYEMWCG